MGSVKRQGPALPGLTNRTPFRISAFGLWEWPVTTACTPCRPASNCAMSCTTWIRMPATSTVSRSGMARAQSPTSLLPRTAVTGAMRSSAARISGPPMSPAWTMCSLPCSASSAWGRRRPCVSDIRPMRCNRGLAESGGAACAEEGLHLVRRPGRGEQVALAHPTPGFGKEFALHVCFHALGDDFELEAARKRDQGAREPSALAVARHTGDQLAIDAHCADRHFLEHGQRRVAGAEIVYAYARARCRDARQRAFKRIGPLARRGFRKLYEQRRRGERARMERGAHLVAQAAMAH